MNLSTDMNKPIDNELTPFNDNPNFSNQGANITEFVCGVAYGPQDLDPQFAWDSASLDVIDQVCEGLYKYDLTDPDLAIIPNLATEFGTWSSDKKNYTVPLREGVSFHDGTTFNAASVKWSFDRLQYFMNTTGTLPGGTQVTQIAELYSWPDGIPIINRTEIINSNTIKFILNKPFVPFLGLLCFSGSYILSPISTPAYDYIDTATGDLIGTGPFVYDEYNLDVNVTFHAFENYWRGEAKIKSLIFKIIFDADQRNQALLSGDIDLLGGISFSYLDQMESDPNITVTPCDQSTTIQYLGMNNKQINKTWRKAISYAINYSYIIETLMGGQAVRMKSPVPEGILYANWSFDVATYNLTKAREYMVSMGYGDLGWSNAQWQAATFATFNYTYNIGNSFRENLLILLQDNLDLIGIEVIDAGMTWSEYINRLYYSHDMLQLYWIGWLADYNDPSNFINPLFSNTSINNAAQVNDPYLESLMEAGLEETNPILREAIYDEIQRYIVEDLMPWAFGYVGNYYDAYQSEFTGYPSNPMRKMWLYNVSFSQYEGGKIHINGNQEWLDFKNAGGCTGQGTYSDPYVIKDLIIDGGGSGSCILIENSNVYFKVKNCTVFNAGSSSIDGGIRLNYVENGILIGNNCTEIFVYDIYLTMCNNNTISNNTVDNNLYLYNCNNTKILNNTVGTNFPSSSYIPNGIILGENNNITLSGNIMFNGGIIVQGTIDAMLSTKIDITNLVNGKPIIYYANKTDLGPENFTNAGQVILVNCSDSIIKNLNFSRVIAGISLNYCKNITISNIVASDNCYTGIMLYSCSLINCSNAQISNSSMGMAGIYLSDCNNSLISNNYVSNISYGIYLRLSHNNTILRNTAINTTYYGILLQYSHNNTILRNTAVNTTNYGIGLWLSNYNNISKNYFAEGGYGIYLDSSNNNTIYLNNFINNGLDSISYNSINTWNSSVKIAYTYNNKNYTNYLGNYWDNYTGNDANGDGIGDIPYNIDGDKDYCPLMEPFEEYLVVPSVDSPDDITYEEGTSGYSISWTATDNNPDSYIIYREGVVVDSGSWTSGVPITINVDGLTVGSYNYTIVVTDASNNTATDTVIVTVEDTTAPAVDSPADITYEEGTSGHSISWTATDNNPNSYIIYREGVVVDSGSWTSGVPITVNVDGLTVGPYDYTINVTDASNNNATDTVIVTVEDTTAPAVDSPADITYEEGTTGHSISWNATDNNPGSYVIYKDGIEVNSGSWTSGIPITINVDGLTVGSYNYTINVIDVYDKSATDTVIVTVEDTTAPAVDSPADITYEESTTGHSISWNATDNNPGSYIIYREGVVVDSGSWTSGVQITINVDGLAVGSYDYTINVTDASNNNATDTVIVTVEDTTTPAVDSPTDITYEEGTTGHSISWNATDNNPSSYVIYKDGIEINSSVWTSSILIKINVDGLTVGSYNYTIVVSDAFNNTATDTVLVNVTSPEVIPPVIAGYPRIVLIFSLCFAISIVILIIRRKITGKF